MVIVFNSSEKTLVLSEIPLTKPTLNPVVTRCQAKSFSKQNNSPSPPPGGEERNTKSLPFRLGSFGFNGGWPMGKQVISIWNKVGYGHLISLYNIRSIFLLRVHNDSLDGMRFKWFSTFYHLQNQWRHIRPVWPCFHERFLRSLSKWKSEISWRQLLSNSLKVKRVCKFQ